jgi:hypothetical protein
MRLPALLLALLVPAVAAAGPRWQADHSSDELSATEAEAYCASRGKGWRLPVRSELEKVGGELPDSGYLWSGEDVSAERVGQRWIMNLANRHVFNGSGYVGHAKCVRGPLPKRVVHKLGPAYATIGRANAKLTVVVAMQPDYPWWKIRPTLDELVAKHSVRFDLRSYTVTDRWNHAGVALCVAAQARRLGELEAKLREAGAKADLEAAGVRELAIAAGVAAKRYDRSLAACAKRIASDREALGQRGIDAVPTFWIGATKVVGARPEELTAAILGAL